MLKLLFVLYLFIVGLLRSVRYIFWKMDLLCLLVIHELNDLSIYFVFSVFSHTLRNLYKIYFPMVAKKNTVYGVYVIWGQQFISGIVLFIPSI